MTDSRPQRLGPLPALIFSSRWLQLPLYLGLIAAQAVYVAHFLVELWHLVEAAFKALGLALRRATAAYGSSRVPSTKGSLD